MKMYHEINVEGIQNEMSDAINKVSQIVGMTLGPGGQTVLIDQFGDDPHITKDGVTVLKSIIGRSEEEDIAIRLMAMVAERQFSNIGDGTTTATIMISELISRYVKITGGKVDHELCDLIDSKLHSAARNLKKSPQFPTKEQVDDVILVSCNWDHKIANLVNQAIEAVGQYGAIDIVESSEPQDKVEAHKGMSINSGYFSYHYMNDRKRRRCYYEDANILIYDHFLNDHEAFARFIEAYHAKYGSEPIIIIANDIGPEVNATFLKNIHKGVLSGCMVQWEPSIGVSDYKKDLALISGATYISPEKGDAKLSASNVDDIGTVQKFVANSNSCKFTSYEEFKEPIGKKVLELEESLEDMTDANAIARTKFRIGYLTGGMARLFISGSTAAEIKERIDRVDDAYKAAQKAMEGGIVRGGGVAHGYLSLKYSIEKRCSSTILSKIMDIFNIKPSRVAPANKEMIANEIVEAVLLAPFLKIHSNNQSGMTVRMAKKLLMGLSWNRTVKVNGRGTYEVVETNKAGLWNPTLTEVSAIELARSMFNNIARTGGSLIIQNDKNA